MRIWPRRLDAIQEQLGLELEQRKESTHAEWIPSEN
jgi:hypothetical protein